MKLAELAKELNLPIKPSGLEEMEIYSQIRDYFFQLFALRIKNQFQSPSLKSSTTIQRTKNQNSIEHSVYQRSDYNPLKAENQLNDLYHALKSKNPKTLYFNSGMAAINTLLFFLYHHHKIGLFLVGENAYYETKYLFEDYGSVSYYNDYYSLPKINFDSLWLEYPINCTNPANYPINKSSIIKIHLKQFFQQAKKNKKKKFYLVIDYTLGKVPFQQSVFKSAPENVSIFLVTSLQKHRGYGLDLVNAGAITIFSNRKDYIYLKKLRAIMGASYTQETFWLQPQISYKTINKLIKDSGNIAYNISTQIINRKEVKCYFANNTFKTSFIFLKIDKKLITNHIKNPYLSDLLIKSIIKSAKINKTEMITGTSFGFPFTRIFKNSERYENTDILRIAIGYNEILNSKTAKAINEGIEDFIKGLK